MITTSSNYSTLQAVGDVSEGNLVEGFGKAEVNSLVSVTGTELRGGVSIGNSTDNPIAVHGFITTDHLVFDADGLEESSVCGEGCGWRNAFWWGCVVWVVGEVVGAATFGGSSFAGGPLGWCGSGIAVRA